MRPEDEAEFAGLVERQWRFAYRVAWAVLRNAHDAEDAAQEAFLKIWRARATGRGLVVQTDAATPPFGSRISAGRRTRDRGTCRCGAQSRGEGGGGGLGGGGASADR